MWPNLQETSFFAQTNLKDADDIINFGHAQQFF